MTQRKAKEPLLTEVPKPRLSDDELMELFYSKRQGKSPFLATESVGLSNVSAPLEATFQTTTNKPSLQEPTLRKPSLQEPAVQEPTLREPTIQKGTIQEPSLQEPFRKSEHSPKILLKHTEIEEIIPGGNTSPSAISNEPVPQELRSQEPAKKEALQKRLPNTETFTPARAGLSPEVFRAAFEILPTLGPLEQLFYLWFLHLSRAFGQESCRVTMALLQRATGVSEKLVRENLRSLLSRGYLTLLDGGAAGRAALYHVVHPSEIMERQLKGSLEEPSLKEPSPGNLPYRNLPAHIERERESNTLSNREPSFQEGSLGESFPKAASEPPSLATAYPPALLDSVLDRFYSMTGQLRISRQKRERSRFQLLDLLREGFRLDDILYTIDWAREHISTPIHSFGLIPEIIGQALGKREAAVRERQRLHTRPTASSAPTEQEANEQTKIAQIQASLTPEELALLQNEAEGLVDKEYGPHVPGRNTLVRIKKAEIVRERYLRADSRGKDGS